MYFNAETQARILDRFHFALNDDGFLFLGQAETLLTHTDLFAPVDLKRRIFRKVAAPDAARPAASWRRARRATRRGDRGSRHAARRRVRRHARPRSSWSTATGPLALANEPARVLFGLDADRPRPAAPGPDLSYRPVELRSRIERPTPSASRSRWRRRRVAAAAGERALLDVHVTPLSTPAARCSAPASPSAT